MSNYVYTSNSLEFTIQQDPMHDYVMYFFSHDPVIAHKWYADDPVDLEKMADREAPILLMQIEQRIIQKNRLDRVMEYLARRKERAILNVFIEEEVSRLANPIYGVF